MPQPSIVLNPGERRSRLAGWLLLLMLLLALAAALVPAVPPVFAGLLIWLAAILLPGRLRGAQRIQVGAMFGVGVTGLVAGLWQGAEFRHLVKALEANQMVVAMLMGVSFLRLITAADLDRGEALPSGVRALTKTLIGAHLIGAVINISTVLLVGDRLSHRGGKLTPLQGMVVLRAFSTAAFWSPFFAAMGIALVSAPGAQLWPLVWVGLPVAVVALAFSAWQVARHPEANNTPAYPMQLGALWLPLLLAVLVILGHRAWPSVPVLTLVTLISLVFAVGWVTVGRGGAGAIEAGRHISQGLPRLGGEVRLFLAAAVLAAGIAALLDSFDIQLQLTQFGANQAFIVLLIMIALAVVGMHPVTTVTLAGSLLAPVVDDHNLLGITFLMSWSVGVALSPFSGVQLSLQSRYQVSLLELMRMNAGYALVILAVDFAALHAYVAWSG